MDNKLQHKDSCPWSPIMLLWEKVFAKLYFMESMDWTGQQWTEHIL